jgi:hypothetical protein
MANNKYYVVYAFDGYLWQECYEAISLVIETAAKMRRDGIDIEFLGATQRVDSTGQPIEITIRYAAPSMGAIGQLNCRACLPASGPPQPIPAREAASEDQPVVVARH